MGDSKITHRRPSPDSGGLNRYLREWRQRCIPVIQQEIRTDGNQAHVVTVIGPGRLLDARCRVRPCRREAGIGPVGPARRRLQPVPAGTAVPGWAARPVGGSPMRRSTNVGHRSISSPTATRASAATAATFVTTTTGDATSASTAPTTTATTLPGQPTNGPARDGAVTSIRIRTPATAARRRVAIRLAACLLQRRHCQP